MTAAIPELAETAGAAEGAAGARAATAARGQAARSSSAARTDAQTETTARKWWRRANNAPAPSSSTSSRSWSPPAWNETPASTAAGVVLAVLAWAWVVRPLLDGGPDEVRNVLRAKFFNKGRDGGWLT